MACFFLFIEDYIISSCLTKSLIYLILGFSTSFSYYQELIFISLNPLLISEIAHRSQKYICSFSLSIMNLASLVLWFSQKFYTLFFLDIAVDRTLLVGCSFLRDLIGERDILLPFCACNREGVLILLVSRIWIVCTFSLAKGAFILQKT